MKANLTNKQVEEALQQCVSFSHPDSLCHVQHSTDALSIMVGVCCATDGNFAASRKTDSDYIC